MFKGYHNSNSSPLFRGIPNLNFQGNVNAYGFSGVSFWLDAAFGLNTQTNLGAISSWTPRFGRSSFEQSTAGNQPRLILNDANFNNLPSVQAQDNARFLTSTNGYGLSFDNGCTIAIISKVNTNNTFNGIIGQNSASRLGIHDGGTQAGINGFGIAQGGANLSFIGTTESTNTRIKIISNNNILVNGNIEFTGTNTINVELFQLFRITNENTHNLIGSISEIIAYNFNMTSQQCIDLSNNINQKYAIY